MSDDNIQGSRTVKCGLQQTNLQLYIHIRKYVFVNSAIYVTIFVILCLGLVHCHLCDRHLHA